MNPLHDQTESPEAEQERLYNEAMREQRERRIAALHEKEQDGN